VLAHRRQLGNELIVVALNTTSQPRHIPITGRGETLLSTRLDRKQKDRTEGIILLRADEGVILKMAREANAG
jgi:hypothetical protein